MNNILIFVLSFVLISCSKSDDDKFENGQQLFVREGKEYFFHRISHWFHPIITKDSIGNIDTLWNTKITDTYSVYFQQDTSIRDTLYKFVWYKTLNNDYKIGVIREDSIGKVFYRTSPFWPEYLLYDFNLKENETYNNLVVKKIDFIVNSKYKRKQLLLSQCCGRDTLFWIAGIGNINDILTNRFPNSCYCNDDGIIESITTGGGSHKTKLLFVRYNDNIIYKSDEYLDSPDNFKYVQKTDCY